MASITTEGRSELIALYTAIFNAAPGATNLSEIVLLKESGKSLEEVATFLTGKADFAKVYPALLTADEFAARLVANMVPAETSADAKSWATNWVKSQLASGKGAAFVFASAVQAVRSTTNPEFQPAKDLLANKVDVSTYFSVTKLLSDPDLVDLQNVLTGVSSSSASVTTAKAAVDVIGSVVTPVAFPLTTGVESKTLGAGNDTFDSTNTAASQTLNAGDVLVGGDGTDRLAIVSSIVGGTLGQGVQTTSVEQLSVNAVKATTVDASTMTGVTDVYNNASLEAVTVTGLNALANVHVLNTNQSTTVTFASAATTAGLADAITVALTGAALTGSNAVTVNGIETINVVATGTSGATNADGSTFGTTINSDALKTLTVAGTGTAKITATMSGAQTGTTGVAATVTGSSGADDIQIGLPAATSKISANLGTGDDIVRLASLDAAQTIAGGDGSDTLVFTGAATATAAAIANISSFEKVVVSGAGNPLIATSDLTYTAAAAQTYTNLAAGGTVNLRAGGSLTLANTALTGLTDAVTVNVGTSSTVGATGVTLAAGTHDVVTVNSLTRSDTLSTAVAAVSVTGTTLNKVTLNAPHAVTLSGGGTALTSIDASGVVGAFTNSATVSSTAAVSITGGAGADVIVGGAFNDVLTGNGGNDTITGGVGADNITGGAGSDVFVVGVNAVGAVVSSSAAPDVITDFLSGTDRIVLSQQNDRFAGNVANIQLGLAAMTGANQSFFVTSENTLYVVAGFANNAGVLANTDTIVRLTGITSIAAADLGVGVAAAGSDTTLSNTAGAALATVNLTTATNAAATPIATSGQAALTAATTSGANDTVRATSAQLAAVGGNASTIAGGNGSDTLIISTGGTLVAADLAVVTGFETISLVEAPTGTTTVSHDVTLSANNVATGGSFAVSAAGVSTVAVRVTAAAVADTTSSLTITGGSFATAAGDTLIGGSGNDTINGGAGNDTITGGAGNDSLVGGLGDDTVVAAGTDIIDGGAGNDVVQIGTGALGASATDLAGIELGAGVNRINFTGATGSSAFATIAATGGVYDILIDNGGGGSTATMTPSQFAGAYRVLGVNGGAAENITFSAAGTINTASTTDILGITLSGVSGTSTTGANSLTISAGITSVVGAGGNDTINAAGGDVAEDLLEGTVTAAGGTADTVSVTGNGNMTAGGTGAIVIAATVTGVETITFANTTAGVTLTTDTANAGTTGTLTVNATSMTTGVLTFDGAAETDGGIYVVSSGAGADVLTGGAGADVFNAGTGANTVTGGAGADSITGGALVDRLYGDNGGTKAVSTIAATIGAAATGTVTVTIAGIATTIAAGADAGATETALAAAINGNGSLAGIATAAVAGGDLVVTFLIDGAIAATAVGSNGANTFAVTATATGTAGVTGNDTIIGGASADVIVGGGGADVLTGDAGIDNFVFLKAHSVLGSIATITDYRAAAGNNAGALDTIVLGNQVTAAGTVGTVQDFSSAASLGAALNLAAAGNTVADGLVVFMYGGDTYGLVETTQANTAYTAGDFLIKITGTPFTTATALAGLGFDGV